MYIPSKEVVV
ncbi:uncharacterized protein FFM5_15338 [Fusarium fujikuroi]|nr:uncharacterized protein FFM5_15338 [Fusarium fujikuroi]